MILEVTDEGSPKLTFYRRIILRVRPKPNGPSAQELDRGTEAPTRRASETA
jgi:hypothetical protein